jgi:hypothetical protein
MLRSIRPTRARASLAASVDPTEARKPTTVTNKESSVMTPSDPMPIDVSLEKSRIPRRLSRSWFKHALS